MRPRTNSRFQRIPYQDSHLKRFSHHRLLADTAAENTFSSFRRNAAGTALRKRCGDLRCPDVFITSIAACSMPVGSMWRSSKQRTWGCRRLASFQSMKPFYYFAVCELWLVTVMVRKPKYLVTLTMVSYDRFAGLRTLCAHS